MKTQRKVHVPVLPSCISQVRELTNMLAHLKKSSKQKESSLRKDRQRDHDSMSHDAVVYAARDSDTGLEFTFSAPPSSNLTAKAQQIAAKVYSHTAPVLEAKTRLLTDEGGDRESEGSDHRATRHDHAAVEGKHTAVGFRHDSGSKTTYVLKGRNRELFASAPNGSAEAAINDRLAQSTGADTTTVSLVK